MLYDDLEKTQVPRDASPEVVRGALASLYRTPEAVQDIVTSLSKEPVITFSEEDLLHVPFEGIQNVDSKCPSMIIVSQMS